MGKKTRARRRLGKYFLGKTLGKGATSRVKLGLDPSTREKIALKVILPSSSERDHQRMTDVSRTEIQLLRYISHKNGLGVKFADPLP